MKARALGIAALLGLAACNANPLLKEAASNYAPAKVGSRWDFQDPAATLSVSRKVTGTGPYQGKDAYSVDTSINGGPPSTNYIAFEGGEELQYSSSLADWILYRRLPLVSNNRWSVPSGNPLVTTTVIVDGLEGVTVPAGRFDNCWRVRTRNETYDPVLDVTTTAETLAWAAPDVGDVRYADLASNGAVTVTLELTGYTLP
jgi:hypothetical protein